MTQAGPTRRALLAGLSGAALSWPLAGCASPSGPSLRVADDVAGRPISPLIYGSNEIGRMDGGPLSATLDRHAMVAARRLGGNLMTAYNWVNNASNAGKDNRHSNGPFLMEALALPKSEWGRPGLVIEAMHEASLAMGAKSLVTLPLAGYVAADFLSVVPEEEAAPSRRFTPTRWSGATKASDPIDPGVADMPQLLARLVERYGGADTSRGVHAYALDNEPAIWFQNHPRVTPQRVTIRDFIARSIVAARAIKAVDPAAKVFGPSSWGATGMVSFQDAPDWPEYKRYGSFLAAYLDAFRMASERDGLRLLDVLDVHWYPFSNKGELFRTETPELDRARLDAPRSLTEPGFREDSWVPRALRNVEGLALPILPSLTALAARWFPGTQLAVTEFNYGGAGRLTSGLALADALGRFGQAGVYFASHWGSLPQWLGEAYRLYRAPDAAGGDFGPRGLDVAIQGLPGLAAYAADDGKTLRLVLINRGEAALSVDVGFASGRLRRPAGVIGFDADRPQTTSLAEEARLAEGGWRIVLPPRAARRYAFS